MTDITHHLIAGSMKRSGEVINGSSIYVALPEMHSEFYKRCKREFREVYIAGQYAEYLAREDPEMRSYWMYIIIDAEGTDSWINLWRRVEEIGGFQIEPDREVGGRGYHRGFRHHRKTPGVEQQSVWLHPEDFVRQSRDAPFTTGIIDSWCAVTIFKIEKSDSVSEIMSVYYNLYQLLRSIISPLTRVVCECEEDGTVILYNLIDNRLLSPEVHKVAERADSYDDYMANHSMMRDERLFFLRDVRNDYDLMDKALVHFYSRKKVDEVRRSRLVPTLQLLVLRVLMHNFIIWEIRPSPEKRAEQYAQVGRACRCSLCQ